jgi:hypothetical protein
MPSERKRTRHEAYRKRKGWRPVPMTLSQWFASLKLSAGRKRDYKRKKRKHLLERRRRARLKRRRAG